MNFPSVLVLGATGRIGRILRHCWQQVSPGQGSLGDILWQRRARVANHPVTAALNWAVFDPLTDPLALTQAAQGRAAILCLAGVIPGRGSGQGAGGDDLEANWHLAEAAIRAAATAGTPGGTRVLLASSAAVYGNQPGRLAETTPLRPANDYGVAKAEMEQRSAALAARLGVPLCALRIGNIAGIDAALGGWRPGFQLDQFADGSTPQRSYIGGLDLARVLGDLLRHPGLPEVLNIAAPGLVQMGALLTAAGLDWVARPAPQTAIAQVELDCELLQGLSPLAPADAVQMVTQWRILEPHTAREPEAK